MRRLIYQCLVLFSLALIPAVAAGLWHPSRPSWQADQLREGEVTLDTVRAWAGPVLWLDARSAEAYETDHMPGAQLLNEDNWEALIEPVFMAWDPGPPETRVVIYCDSQACSASEEVAERLRDETGWPDVYVLHGGWAVLAGEAK